MSEAVAIDYTKLTLPPSVVTKRDISRLVAEAERIDDEMTTATVRAHVSEGVAVSPALSGQFSDFLAQNSLVFEEGGARTELIQQLRKLKDHAPVIHLTLAVPGDAESLQRLTQWFRDSVHLHAVVAVGIQPALVAGVYVRTTNRVFDYSLRHALQDKHGLLVDQLEALRGGK